MNKVRLAPPPAWAPPVHATVIVLSLAVLLLPEARVPLTTLALNAAYFMVIGNVVYRGWRAGLLHMTLSEGARHAQSTPIAVRTLEAVSAILGSVAITVLTLWR